MLGAKLVTVFLDACFSGGSRTGEMLLAESRPFIPVKISKIEQNITVFSATAAEQKSSISVFCFLLAFLYTFAYRMPPLEVV